MSKFAGKDKIIKRLLRYLDVSFKVYMNKILMLSILFLLLSSCAREKKIKEAVKAIPVEVQIERFDLKFAEATPENWKLLRKAYPFFFPKIYSDSIWEAKTTDTLQKALETEVHKVFSDFSEYEDEIKLLFKHVKYYFPDFKEPVVYTVISDVDYQNSVVLTDSLMVVGLDNFLGAEHPFYSGISRYIAKNMKKEQLIPDMAEVLAQKHVPLPVSNTFMEKMVYYGKVLYLKQLFLPLHDEERLIGYTPGELDWARANESEIWRYFIERELLFSTHQNLDSRFLNNAPFSKFYLDLDNESPGRLGQYMGWQIVNAYMKNNSDEVGQMLALPGEELFKKSKFKPRK